MIQKQADVGFSLEFAFQVNATNIVALNKNNRVVEVYNFKLELVRSIKLDTSCDDLKLNNYEIALKNYNPAPTSSDEVIVACYNYKTLKTKKKQIALKYSLFERIMQLREINANHRYLKLIGLNDRFLFMGVGYFNRSDVLFVFDREDDNNLYKYFNSWDKSAYFYYSEVFFVDVYCYDDEDEDSYDNAIIIHDMISSDGNNPTILGVDDRKFIHFYPTSNYKYMYLQEVKEDDLTLKFCTD